MQTANNRIDTKFYPLAWLSLMLGALARNAYYIASFDAVSYTGEGAGTVALVCFYVFALRVLVPTALAYILITIAYSMVARRGFAKVISRSDFSILTMFFVGGAMMLAGGVEAFAFLDSRVFDYTAAVADIALYSTALFIEYFAVLHPKYIKRTAMSGVVFSVWSTVYFVWQALSTLLPCVVVIFIATGQSVPALEDYLEQYTTAGADLYPCVAAVCVYVAYLIGAGVAYALLFQGDKKMRSQSRSSGDVSPDGTSDGRVRTVFDDARDARRENGSRGNCERGASGERGTNGGRGERDMRSSSERNPFDDDGDVFDGTSNAEEASLGGGNDGENNASNQNDDDNSPPSDVGDIFDL